MSTLAVTFGEDNQCRKKKTPIYWIFHLWGQNCVYKIDEIFRSPRPVNEKTGTRTKISKTKGGRGHWTVNYTGNQSFKTNLSYSLA